jgi:hypothetical protein
MHAACKSRQFVHAIRPQARRPQPGLRREFPVNFFGTKLPWVANRMALAETVAFRRCPLVESQVPNARPARLQ